MKINKTLYISFIFASLLTACGGGGGSSNDDNADTGDTGGSDDDITTGIELPHLMTASHAVDVDGDGDLDLIVSNQGDQRSDSDLLLINNGNFEYTASFTALPARYRGKNGATVSITDLDANSDGTPDILAVTVDAGEDYYGNSQLQLWLGDGEGGFTQASQQISNNQLNGWPEWTRVGDFDNDGHTDFMLTVSGCGDTTSEGSDDLVSGSCYGGRTYLNDGNGNFSVATMTMTDHLGSLTDHRLLWRSEGNDSSTDTSLRTALDVLVDDFDGDGKTDLFAPNGYAQGAMATFINESTPGNLSYRIVYSGYPSNAQSSVYSTPQLRNGLAIDINGDDIPDALGSFGISIGPDETTPVYALINDGTGVFSFNDTVITGGLGVVHARQWLKADFNNDGYDDALIANHGYDRDDFPGEPNLLLLSDGQGMLLDRSGELGTANTFSHGASVGDLNNDGNIDLFLNNGVNTDGSSVTWENEAPIWRNDTGSTFTNLSPTISD